MNDLSQERTYTADEVRSMINEVNTDEGNSFRRAFEEMQHKLEDAYALEIKKIQGRYEEQMGKIRRMSRWITWGGWAMFWLSGFLFRPFFDMVWKHV